MGVRVMTLATDIDYLPREVYRGKWIVIHQNYRPPARKTHVYAIYSKSGDMKIAEIRWYGPWRQYALFPEPDTVWAGSCFDDIVMFMNSLKVKP